jgi:hypothetical protein
MWNKTDYLIAAQATDLINKLYAEGYSNEQILLKLPVKYIKYLKFTKEQIAAYYAFRRKALDHGSFFRLRNNQHPKNLRNLVEFRQSKP